MLNVCRIIRKIWSFGAQKREWPGPPNGFERDHGPPPFSGVGKRSRYDPHLPPYLQGPPRDAERGPPGRPGFISRRSPPPYRSPPRRPLGAQGILLLLGVPYSHVPSDPYLILLPTGGLHPARSAKRCHGAIRWFGISARNGTEGPEQPHTGSHKPPFCCHVMPSDSHALIFVPLIPWL